MTRGAAIRLTLGFAMIGVALWLWLRPRVIEVAQADAIAKAYAVRYAAATRQPVSHFGRARRIVWPDGWEFVWTYRPCPADTALRVFVPTEGHGARITQSPDCEEPGLGTTPVPA